MTFETAALISSAVTVGFLHTILGPDHTLPFVALAHAGRWRMRKTLFVTFLCGLGHILGAVILGWVGMALGSGIVHAARIESVRSEITAWAFVLFGLTYLIWGIRSAGKPDAQPGVGRLAKVLFVVFVLGPCEPLIPLLLYPAAQKSPDSLMILLGTFSAATIITMMGTVAFLLKGVSLLPARRPLRFVHAWAGIVLIVCGIAMKLGL